MDYIVFPIINMVNQTKKPPQLEGSSSNLIPLYPKIGYNLGTKIDKNDAPGTKRFESREPRQTMPCP